MTLQAMDTIHLHGKSYSMLSLPLSSHPNIETIEKIIANSQAGINSGCWRGFTSEWAVVDNSLYLVDISSMSNTSFYKKFFGEKPMLASWVNQKIEILLDGTHPYNRTGNEITKLIVIEVREGKVFEVKEKEIGK